MWWNYGHDAYYAQVLEWELGHRSGITDPRDDIVGGVSLNAERPAAVRWVAAWIGCLSVFSLFLGLASLWLLQ